MATSKPAKKPTKSTAKKPTTPAGPRNEKLSYTVPGVPVKDGQALAQKLQMRLHALNDLHLTLKHAHWNVVGPKFIGVHEMLDPQVEAVRAMVDVIAERMRTMGVAPVGTPGALVQARSWEDYPVMTAQAAEHLAALDLVYSGVIEDHRSLVDESEQVDPITQDILIGQVTELEKFQWFVRSHLIDDSGKLATDGATTIDQAVKQGIAADRSVD
ncbi:DNA starvation/stationary phase protection protein [Luteococcus peritonei]|uniref:DNA starvation/stationary phase protection protein n=1 Tax=Luteococcus peritonei TaxID=88874 RepID=A0ABW4RU86_9ACTN